jgi:hypothetical protein
MSEQNNWARQSSQSDGRCIVMSSLPGIDHETGGCCGDSWWADGGAYSLTLHLQFDNYKYPAPHIWQSDYSHGTGAVISVHRARHVPILCNSWIFRSSLLLTTGHHFSAYFFRMFFSFFVVRLLQMWVILVKSVTSKLTSRKTNNRVNTMTAKMNTIIMSKFEPKIMRKMTRKMEI